MCCICTKKWVEDPEALIKVLQWMNDEIAKDIGDIKPGGVVRDFEESRGAVVKLWMSPEVVEGLKTIHFTPRLLIGRITMWGPGHKWRDRPNQRRQVEEDAQSQVDEDEIRTWPDDESFGSVDISTEQNDCVEVEPE